MVDQTVARRRGRPPGRKLEITRERLLDAAEKCFLEKGFLATSVQEIAAEAGYTTGALYWSFSGKHDVFLAVYRRRIALQQQIWRNALESVTNATDAAAAMGEALALAMPDPAWYPVQLEFLSYAARDEHLGREAAEVFNSSERAMAEMLREVAPSTTLPLDRLAEIVAALGRGLSLKWYVDPGPVDMTLFSDGVALLFGVADSNQVGGDVAH